MVTFRVKISYNSPSSDFRYFESKIDAENLEGIEDFEVDFLRSLKNFCNEFCKTMEDCQ